MVCVWELTARGIPVLSFFADDDTGTQYDADYAKQLHEDFKIRNFLKKKLALAGISRVIVERPAKKARITIHSARPGVVIGKKGQDIDALKNDLQKMTGGEVYLNIVEVKKPDLDAQLVAESIAQQLERRVSFRRAMKRSVQSAMRQGAEGIRINCGGRLGGAEIARTEWYREGRVPLHTLFKGEILAHDPMAQDKRLSDAQR